MKVTLSTNYSNTGVQNNRTHNTQFKAITPVVICAKDATGKFSPVANVETVQKMQAKLIRMLNKRKPKTEEEKNFVEDMEKVDTDYRRFPIVRSFYNRIKRNPYVSYILSGEFVGDFEKKVNAHDIGTNKSLSKDLFGTPYSYEAKNSIDNYNVKGLEYVNDSSRRVKKKDGDKNVTQVLRADFEITKDKKGKEKYNFIGAKWYPEFGPNSLFEEFKKL